MGLGPGSDEPLPIPPSRLQAITRDQWDHLRAGFPTNARR